MTKKSWRNPNEEIQVMPKKFNWKSHKVFDDYTSADAERNKLLEDGKEFIKIKRCGPDGIRFKVKIGHPVKVKKENQPTTKKSD